MSQQTRNRRPMDVARRLRRFIQALLHFELGRPRPAVIAGGFALVLTACAGNVSNKGKLDEAVQELNLAMRFGRTDVAAERLAKAGGEGFRERHKLWGKELQVVDVELGGVEKMDSKEAIVLVSYSWSRNTEGRLRTTVVRQTWTNTGSDWRLANEERASGDVGLLGEPPVTVLGPKAAPAHFRTVVIPGG